MNEIIKQYETALYNIAEEYTPPGSDVRSVIHQWLHAIVSKSDLFGSSRGVEPNKIINCLRKEKLYTSNTKFKKEILSEIHIKNPIEKTSFRFIDLFAGIGGMRLGFEGAGGTCVFSSEFEKNAQSTYCDNFGEFPFGDITKISEYDIPNHNVLIAGFPCQPFSHAGLKLGVDDTRGTLFYDIARILKEKQPEFALLENVKGLISHDKGHTLKVILNTLLDMGYQCILDEELIRIGKPEQIKKEASRMILKARDFGIPQNRQRIYIVLWRKDLKINFSYPEPTGIKTRVGDILETKPHEKYTISDRLWSGHQKRRINNKINGKGFGYGLVSPDSEYTNTISARYYKDGSEILISQKDKNPRKLSPREAASLQGFPKEFLINKSDVQAYKQFGNSVSIPVVNAIAVEIVKSFFGGRHVK